MSSNEKPTQKKGEATDRPKETPEMRPGDKLVRDFYELTDRSSEKMTAAMESYKKNRTGNAEHDDKLLCEALRVYDRELKKIHAVHDKNTNTIFSALGIKRP